MHHWVEMEYIGLPHLPPFWSVAKMFQETCQSSSVEAVGYVMSEVHLSDYAITTKQVFFLSCNKPTDQLKEIDYQNKNQRFIIKKIKFVTNPLNRSGYCFPRLSLM